MTLWPAPATSYTLALEDVQELGSVSPDGRFVGVEFKGQRTAIIDAASGRLAVDAERLNCKSLYFAPDCRHVAFSHGLGLAVADLETGTVEGQIEEAYFLFHSQHAFSSDSNRMFVIHREWKDNDKPWPYRFETWDWRSGKLLSSVPLGKLAAPPATPIVANWTADGRTFAYVESMPSAGKSWNLSFVALALPECKELARIRLDISGVPLQLPVVAGRFVYFPDAANVSGPTTRLLSVGSAGDALERLWEGAPGSEVGFGNEIGLARFGRPPNGLRNWLAGRNADGTVRWERRLANASSGAIKVAKGSNPAAAVGILRMQAVPTFVANLLRKADFNGYGNAVMLEATAFLNAGTGAELGRFPWRFSPFAAFYREPRDVLPLAGRRALAWFGRTGEPARVEIHDLPLRKPWLRAAFWAALPALVWSGVGVAWRRLRGNRPGHADRMNT